MTQVAKSIALSSAFIGILFSAGCASSVSHDINNAGHVPTSDIVFPELDDAWQKEGIFPNKDSLNKIRPGIGKDSLYQLLSYPHFNESQHAREWDYIFNFYQEDGSTKICQYKLIFDTDYRAQEFYWKPADCAQYAKLDQATVAPVITAQPIASERINLSADALFAFDKWQTQDMSHDGRRSLNELATKLREYQNRGDSRIVITGYTDRLGDAMYNLSLSQLRAQTVREYLITQGVEPASMISAGAGESNPVKSCADSLGRQALINCLQPNRRVQVDVKVYEQTN